MQKHQIMYSGELVTLRAFELDDLDEIMQHWNNYELRKFVDNVLPVSSVSEKEWLERVAKLNPWRDHELLFAITETKTGKLIGGAGLHDISFDSRHTEFGISIYNPDYWSKGYGTDATTLTLWIAFHILGLNSVTLRVFEYNTRAIKAYEKCGFKRVGILRKRKFIDGDFHDEIIMDFLADEFFERFPPGTKPWGCKR
ncbi:MAG: GNAT family N-acetyltransferase [Candidatus Lokiarchaeota archaeon]|nr:GNAT family N-acetyltransferase [Candidatus Lokiarchaeota archaeon]